jgi:hypothetical protein
VWRVAAAPRGASLVFRFLSLLCPHSCAPPHRQIYMADTSNIKYHVSRIQCNPDPASAVRPIRGSGVDRRGARRRTHRHTRRSAFALTFALITRRFNPSNKPDAKYPTRPICGALSSLRIGDSKDSHLSRLSLVCCA